MEARKLQEIEFHNMLREKAPQQRWTLEDEQRLESNPLWANYKYYSAERKSVDLVEDFLRQRCPGSKVLDYCCGNGDDTVKMATFGAWEAVGIDISDVGIEHGRRRAQQEGVADRTKFFVMDAEKMGFEDDSFDVIKAYGCLHHLDLDKAFSELARVLKPGGVIICTEALGHNPLIHLYRKMTPHLRTPWEVDHLLQKKSLRKAEAWFGEVHPQFFHLATLFAVPLRRFGFFPRLLALLEAVDSVMLRLPVIKWQAWQVVFTLAQPRKKATAAARAAHS